MVFKFHTFVPGDVNELNYARPGSPPAFFSFPSPVSPRACGNCLPGITTRASKVSVSAAARRSKVRRKPHSRTDAVLTPEVKIRVEPSNSLTKDKDEVTILDNSSLDDIIKRLKDAGWGKVVKLAQIYEGEIRLLCETSKKIFLQQPNLLELQAPIKICGDIHGQFDDLLRLFKLSGFPPTTNYLFLGNYVNFGKQSLETICLLLAYKIKYPNNFFLLRGNHECDITSWECGFYEECKQRFNMRLWRVFVECFSCLPAAAIVNERIFCVHGGLSPHLTDLDQIRNIVRPNRLCSGLLHDLLWSDPDSCAEGWGTGDEIGCYRFGTDKVREFLERHNLDLICRGKQVVEDGYKFFTKEKQLVTIFSAPNYRGMFKNAGGVLYVDETLMCSFKILGRDYPAW